MKRILAIILMLAFASLTLAGCAQNPRGTFGPAWDVPIKLPLIEEEREEITNLLEGEEGVDLTGDVVAYQMAENLESIDIGSQITSVELPAISQSVSLKPITVDNVISASKSISIPAGADGSSTYDQSTSVTISEFDSITFSSDTINQMDITITAPTNFDITSLNLTLQDTSSGANLGKLDFTGITAGSSDTQSIDLSADVINGSIDLVITNLATTGTAGTADTMTLDYGIPQAKITKVVNYNLSATTINQPVTKSISDTSVEAITFASGSLNSTITAPSGSNLQFNVDSINIDSQDASDLTSKTINTSGGISLDFALTVSGTSVTYDASQSITVDGGFSSDTAIESVTATINQSDSFGSDTDPIDVPAEVNDLTLNDLNLDIVVENKTDLVADLGGITFTAKDENDIPLDSFTLADTGTAQVQARETTEIPLVGGSETDLLGLLYAEGASYIEIGGNYVVGDGSSVTISKDDNLNLSTGLNMNFNLTLNKDIVQTMPPKPVEGLSQDDADFLKQGIKSAKLATTIDNQLPISVIVEFYVASIDNAENKTEEQLRDTLYGAEPFKRLEMIKRVKEEKELVFVAEEADIFTQDNLYVGTKIIIPAGDIVLETDDYIEITDTYTVLTAKANQFSNDK